MPLLRLLSGDPQKPGVNMRFKKLLRRLVYRAAIYLRETDTRQITESGSDSSGYLPESSDSFVLDDRASIRISGPSSPKKNPRWFEPTHLRDRRRALALMIGEKMIVTRTLRIPEDSTLLIRYASAQPVLGHDGLKLELSLQDKLNPESLPMPIAELIVDGGIQPQDWTTATFDLGRYANRPVTLSVTCKSGVSSDAKKDTLAIAELAVARSDNLPAVRARTFRDLRIDNEAMHFQAAYKHEMYSKIHDRQASGISSNVRPVRILSQGESANLEDDRKFPEFIHLPPQPDEVAFEYASRLLGANLRQTPPDFANRLKRRSEKEGKVRVLSLCSGAARIEAGYSAAVPNNVDWCLLDINEELLHIAASQFPSSVTLDLIKADANELRYSGEHWDIILCVSGLHHLVELESVMRFIHQSLKPGGEFWSIGECVGRNGNRLWADARNEANAVFSKLPAKYRRNHHTGFVDETMPDDDYSVGCFEGIRSEDIEPPLDRWFVPVDVYRRNCFLWRLVNLAYSDNYDLSNQGDVDLIAEMVKREILHQKDGGRSTELYGVYKLRAL